MRLLPVFALGLSTLCLTLTGCSLSSTASPSPEAGSAISGVVYGGRQPIIGAHVYLMAAGTAGYGLASSSLLTSGISGTDAVGGYVLTGTGGAFTITGDYTCTANTQVYVYALGGDAGAGTNSAAGLLAALGNCPTSGSFALSTPTLIINEVTTVAAAYATAGFATDATHIGSSGTTQALVGIQNAFANAANLANLSTGAALTTNPAGTGTVPKAEINTLANILASCVNSTGSASTSCSTLFANARSAGTSGTVATDTATAAINIAHHPGNAGNNPGTNVAALYALATSLPPFQPALSAQPADFSIAIVFINNSSYIPVAIDAFGDAWFPGHNSVIEYSSSGALLSPANGFTGGGLSNPISISIDPTENVWLANGSNGIFPPVFANSLSEFSNGGTPLSGTGFTGNGLSQPGPLAIDGAGGVWVGNGLGGTISKFTNTGAAAANSPFTSGGLAQVNAMAIDNSGDLWESSQPVNSQASWIISELTNAGVVVTASTINFGAGFYAIGAIDSANNIFGVGYSQALQSSTNQVLTIRTNPPLRLQSPHRPTPPSSNAFTLAWASPLTEPDTCGAPAMTTRLHR